MFGVFFMGHPDLRRILMWETYAEGYPLRKSFPCAGTSAGQSRRARRWPAIPRRTTPSRSLSIADEYQNLPPDMRERLKQGKRGFVE